MRFCLHVELPCKIDVGQNSYELELVEAATGDRCWLRALDLENSVGFLLAHFPDRWEAGAALLTGFDVGNCPLHLAILEELVASGRASQMQPVVVRPVPRRRLALPQAKPEFVLNYSAN